MRCLGVVILLFLSSCFNAPINYAIIPLKKGVDYLKEVAGRCDTVEDIYYYPSNLYSPDYFALTQRCPYTLTILSEPNTTLYIKRKYYDEYAKEYTRYGLEFPYPKAVNKKVYRSY